MKFVIDNNILSNGQLGYLSGNRTSDAHFIVYNLIDLYCNKRKTIIFGCFVDFSKAFDNIPGHTLFKKLLDHNINGNLYNCLFIRGTSPLLFNNFLSDLQQKQEIAKNSPQRYPESTFGVPDVS